LRRLGSRHYTGPARCRREPVLQTRDTKELDLVTPASRPALRFLLSGALLAGVLAGFPAGAPALPQRSLVARPLPPGVLAATEAAPGAARLDAALARTLTDSTLAVLGELRGLRPLRPVPVRTADRAGIRARLEEIIRQDGIETTLRQQGKLLQYLGLVPPDLDLVPLYHDLLEDQLAGFYDIDRRELVLADWLGGEAQGLVLGHELAHALQDQHFSLRVRKRLGFQSSDAEIAWHALVEGDATAVVAEMVVAPLGYHFPAVADTSSKLRVLVPQAARAAGGIESERFRAAPRAVRENLGFPYRQGMRYVEALYRQGGWAAVDAAYVHPPASTEQLLHPERADNSKDLPVSIQIPDLRGLLGEAYRPIATGTLGEHDLVLYLSQYVDIEVARIAAEGWGGCAYALYGGQGDDPPVFALLSVWDSEDDAVEFFGGLIGALEARYPDQQGDAEGSTQDMVLWNQDPGGRRLNVLRLRQREVMCLESVPGPRRARIVGKLDLGTRTDDPSPEVRSRSKDNLPWNRRAAPVAEGALVPRVDAPEGWTRVETPRDSLAILEAERGPARLAVVVDRQASLEIGLDGYAHTVAERLQRRGQGVYVLTDVDFPREGGRFYQHVFTQTEGDNQVIYYLGVADLGQGIGYLLLTGPNEGDLSVYETAFYGILNTMELVPAVGSAGGDTPGASGPATNDPPHEH
jgi:hypothetical protein